MGKAVSRGQALQISARVATQVNWDELDSEDVQKLIDLSPKEFSKLFTEFIQKGIRLHVSYSHIIDTDAPPFIPGNLTIVIHRAKDKFIWEPSKVSLYLTEKQQNRGYIKGNELYKSLEDKQVMNACVLDYLLVHQELIPEEWKGKLVYFWGTIYCDPDGDMFVRYLHWVGDRWDCNSYWLNDKWYDYEPALVYLGV